MKHLIRKALNAFGYQIYRKKFDRHRDGFKTLKPDGDSIGNVLLAYIIDPFLLENDEILSNSHTHFQESVLIAKTFLDLNYTVDVISYRNQIFKPEKRYDIFLAARTNFQRIAKLLNHDCIKIVNLDMAHWVVNNYNAHRRCLDLYKRRNAVIRNYKLQDENFAIEYADYGTILGNEFTVNTYRYAGKPLFRVPIPTCAVFPSFEEKQFDKVKNNYVWFGSHGFVHKGLDLVLEAFAQMPEFNLTVCGPIDMETDFESVYDKELYNTPNIKTIGWIDVGSDEFKDILEQSIGIVFPSCAEGGGGSVITCMQGGLIPIVTYEASVDVNEEYGIMLETPTIDAIKNAVRSLSGLSGESLREMSKKAREFARMNHTKDIFIKNHREVIKTIVDLEEKKKYKIN